MMRFSEAGIYLGQSVSFKNFSSQSRIGFNSAVLSRSSLAVQAQAGEPPQLQEMMPIGIFSFSLSFMPI